jgi:sulfite reductase (ferredoxin)
MSDEKKKSPVEVAKESSNYLRGSVSAELSDGNDFFSSDNTQLLKHHGLYQQDNRDDRGRVDIDGSKSKSYCFMVRTKIPGGRLTCEQLLAELDLCDEVGNGTLRITSRQGLQLHGVLKGDLRKTLQRIHSIQLSTLAACGDVERNVMCPPIPFKNNPIYSKMYDLARRVAEHLCPRTSAYHEIWLSEPGSDEKHLVAGGENEDEHEPIYGRVYLPRKFKTAVGLPGDNSVDLYTNDLGLLAICENDDIIGYNVIVGGGMGLTPSAKKTYPALGKPMAFVTTDQVIDVATAIVKVQRDFGNRADRKVARLKYTIAEMGGVAAFKSKVEEYYGSPLPPPRPIEVHDFIDGMGWGEQGDGKWFYGLNVENGRIKDTESEMLKTALREVCNTLRPNIRLTPHQSLLFCDIDSGNRERLIEILRRHKVRLSEEISNVRRWSMACPALPTCGLSITESERALPGIIDQLEDELVKLGLERERFTVRMTGCPNACARPYNSDVGLVGKAKGKYTIYVGGRVLGDRLNFIYKDLVPADQIVPTLVPLLNYFKQDRLEGESFGDFCYRKGNDDLLAWSEQCAASR